MTAVAIDPDRLLGALNELRAIGASGIGVNRPAYSEADREAREWLMRRMIDVGLDARIDGIGNVHGRCRRPKAILSGSHSDTVPNGGWLDGAFGVIAALEAARVVNAAARGEIGIDVIAFADEEGTFRGTLGSRAFCGEVAQEELSQARDRQGYQLTDALAACGWAGRPIERLDEHRHLAFIEAHIEQGPVLDASGDEIGIVTGIVGIRRLAIGFAGRADHAGTTPMAMRRDAGAAVAEFAAGLPHLLAPLGGPDTVWNIGMLRLMPGFGNVVPESGEAIIEYRDLDERILLAADEAVARFAAEVAGHHRTTCSIETVARTPPLGTDAALADALEHAASRHGARHRRMPSGAGHDALVIGAHIPAAMVFAPSIGGRSHHVVEDTAPDDLVRVAQVLALALAELVDDDRWRCGR